jgi:hypothetical protein
MRDVQHALRLRRLETRQNVPHWQGVTARRHMCEALLDNGVRALPHLLRDPVSGPPMRIRPWYARPEVELRADVFQCAGPAERGLGGEGFGGLTSREGE